MLSRLPMLSVPQVKRKRAALGGGRARQLQGRRNPTSWRAASATLTLLDDNYDYGIPRYIASPFEHQPAVFGIAGSKGKRVHLGKQRLIPYAGCRHSVPSLPVLSGKSAGWVDVARVRAVIRAPVASWRAGRSHVFAFRHSTPARCWMPMPGS